MSMARKNKGYTVTPKARLSAQKNWTLLRLRGAVFVLNDLGLCGLANSVDAEGRKRIEEKFKELFQQHGIS